MPSLGAEHTILGNHCNSCDFDQGLRLPQAGGADSGHRRIDRPGEWATALFADLRALLELPAHSYVDQI